MSKEIKIRERLLYLLDRFEDGSISRSEQNELLQLKEDIDIVSRENINSAWAKINRSRIINRPSRRVKLIRIAASVAVAVITGLVLYISNDRSTIRHHKDKTIVAAIPSQVNVEIDLNEVYIVAPDGKKKNITRDAISHSINEEIKEIKQERESKEEVTTEKLIEAVEVQEYEVIVPRGVDYNLTLPDGSTVWLAPNSKLIFPDSFGETREVSVVGEAIFDVVKMVDKPFIVKMQDIDVNVLGTMFYVSAIEGSNKTETALIRGSVEVNVAASGLKTVLIPSTKAEYSRGDSELIVEEVDVTPYLKLLKGELFFDDETFENIAKRVERFYNITIQFNNNEVKQKRFYGSIKMGADFEEIFDILSVTEAFSYEINDRVVIIK